MTKSIGFMIQIPLWIIAAELSKNLFVGHCFVILAAVATVTSIVLRFREQ